MKEGSYTKGKWEIGGRTKSLQGLYIHSEGNQLATVFTSVPEAEANAKLIAAAPALLEALKMCIELFDKNEPNWYLLKHDRKIKEAIKKATE